MKKKFVLIFTALASFCAIAFAQTSKMVELTLKNGSVVTGALKSYNPLTEAVITVADIDCIIPSGEIAQMKEIAQPEVVAQNEIVSPSNEVATPAESFPEVDLESFHGFLLEKGNCVCVISNDDVDYELAAVDQIKNNLRRLGYWKVVDKPEQAHFIIQYGVCLKGQDRAFYYVRTRGSYLRYPRCTYNIWNYKVTEPESFILFVGVGDESEATGRELANEYITEKRMNEWYELFNKYSDPSNRHKGINKKLAETIKTSFVKE